jgi:6-methylsalicylate decarboxylase
VPDPAKPSTEKEQIMNTAARIDVHQHVVPPIWAETLAAHGGDPTGSAMPRWSPELAIEFMDSQQIATGILSLTLPSVVGWAEPGRRQMARRVNEYTAELVGTYPRRFGNFATLPLPDVDGALQEIDYALGSLDADGVTLLANYDGTYLGDPTLEPIWEELDRHQAVVFVHPGEPPAEPLSGVATPLVDVLMDTTRTAVQLVLNGTIERHPRARIILAHAGGYLPYAAMRFAELARVFRPDSAGPERLMASFKRFYFDTALSSGPALPSLQAFAASGHTLFGSDFPYAPADVAAPFTATIDAELTAADQAAINHLNARQLFPRLDGLDRSVRADSPAAVAR